MHRKRMGLFFAVCLVMTGGTWGWSGPLQVSIPASPSAIDIAAMFEAADTNNDEKLSFAEAHAYNSLITRDFFNSYDTNGDGYVDRAEAGLPPIDTTPPTGTITINNNRSATNTPYVTLALTWADNASGSGVARMRFSDDGAHWTAWLSLAASQAYTLPSGDGHKTVRVQFLDKANNRSAVYSDYILLDTTPPTGIIIINSGASTTATAFVALGLTWSDGTGAGVTRMRFSNDGAHWTAWELPLVSRAYTLASNLSYPTVRVQFLDGAGNYSAAYSDYIKLLSFMNMLPVAAGTFTMGRTAGGDDVHGQSDEDAQHEVMLAAYQIGKYEVTNEQFCLVLNWALAQGLLKTAANTPWAGSGDLYADADGAGPGNATVVLMGIVSDFCPIIYSAGAFRPKSLKGLPGSTTYSLATHPVQNVSWHGAVAFCNWLSLMNGMMLCYEMNAAGWPLVIAPPASGGYRLPTEAEWERAAAWDGAKHWIYSFMSDTYTPDTRENCFKPTGEYTNPLGLGIENWPKTSPVGWFNGVNVSPNGNVATLNSVSPIGAHDMSGNVSEWCGDWWGYYGSGPVTNPMGPQTGTERILRGGSWYNSAVWTRSATRISQDPVYATGDFGLRVAKS